MSVNRSRVEGNSSCMEGREKDLRWARVRKAPKSKNKGRGTPGWGTSRSKGLDGESVRHMKILCDTGQGGIW